MLFRSGNPVFQLLPPCGRYPGDRKAAHRGQSEAELYRILPHPAASCLCHSSRSDRPCIQQQPGHRQTLRIKQRRIPFGHIPGGPRCTARNQILCNRQAVNSRGSTQRSVACIFGNALHRQIPAFDQVPYRRQGCTDVDSIGKQIHPLIFSIFARGKILEIEFLNSFCRTFLRIIRIFQIPAEPQQIFFQSHVAVDEIPLGLFADPARLGVVGQDFQSIPGQFGGPFPFVRLQFLLGLPDVGKGPWRRAVPGRCSPPAAPWWWCWA